MSPPQQLRQRTSHCSSLLIYRPRKDERLSWSSWLTYSGRFTHIRGHPSATGRAQDSERTPAKDRSLPLDHATTLSFLTCGNVEGEGSNVLRGVDADVQSVSTQPGGRPTILFSGDVSSTRQHYITGMPLKKKNVLYCRYCIDFEAMHFVYSQPSVVNIIACNARA